MKYIAIITNLSGTNDARSTPKVIVADNEELLKDDVEKYTKSLSTMRMEIQFASGQEPVIYNKKWVPETPEPETPQAAKAAAVEL